MPFSTQHPATGPFAPVIEAQWGRLRDAPGAHGDDSQTTFSVFSRHATRILLEIYQHPVGVPCRFDYWLARGEDDIWRARLAEVPAGTLYAFRCWGSNWDYRDDWARGNSGAGFRSDVDREGNRFNPNKLLFDPYARELSHDRETPEMKTVYGHDASMYGTGPDPYGGSGHRHPPVTRRDFDTGPWAPKGIVVRDTTGTGVKPDIAQKDSLIYEAHVRGLTRHRSSARLADILRDVPGFEAVRSVPDDLRGTYAGAACMAPYLKALGITAIELLPVHEFANDLNPEGVPGWDREIDEPPHGNYWGYMTYGFFAPDLRYAYDKSPGGPTREFKRMVRTFHDAGLEVYLDVVFNHSGEGGLWDASGDTVELLCLRGFDNAEYYALTSDRRYYWDSSGCGNNLDASRPVVQALIKDSLTYWTGEMGVDGFRFDLATVLGRTAPNFDFQACGQLLRDIADFADREHIEVIAEAWDLGSYNVGQFPRGWAEWNGAYRDVVRGYLKGDGNAPAFADAVNGDYTLFDGHGGPQKSVNFITAHDGFTLMDLVSYNERNNSVPWPFGPSDGGTESNLSWDSGGDARLRRQRQRNFLTVLMFSRGVPMLLGGDEFARTQNGNNNPYKIDSVGVWHNFDMAGTSSPTRVPTGGSGAYHDNYGREENRHGGNGLLRFFRFVSALRQGHESLRVDRFADLTLDEGGDVTFWFAEEDGRERLRDGHRSVQWRVDGSATGDADFLLCVNMNYLPVGFVLPAPGAGRRWTRLIDTAAWAEAEGNCWPIEEADPMDSEYLVHPYAVAVFQERTER